MTFSRANNPHHVGNEVTQAITSADMPAVEELCHILARIAVRQAAQPENNPSEIEGCRMRKKSAAGYIRASSVWQYLGFFVQMKMLRAFAKLYNFELIKIYVDYGTGDAKNNRRGFDDMMIDALDSRFDFIIMTDPTRLFRDMRLVEEYWDFLHRRNGTDFIFLDELVRMGVPVSAS